jgi:vacuolar-type H+-ATPase subunit I/STV1
MNAEIAAGNSLRDSREGGVFKRRIASTLLVVAIAGLIVSTVIAYQDRMAREDAERQRDTARNVLNEISCSHKKAITEAEKQRDAALQRLSQVEESIGEENSGLEKELQRLNAAESLRIAEIARLTADLQKLNARVRELETQDETASRPLQGTAKPGRDPDPFVVEGKVMAVSANAADLNLMIINIERNKGLAAGAQLTVFRGDKFVTKVQVDKVEGDWASARSLKEFEQEPVQVGDNVTSRVY